MGWPGTGAALKGNPSILLPPFDMTSIWKQSLSAEDLNTRARGTMLEHLDIRFTEIGEDYLRGTMPVDNRTAQPLGLLHGGASVVLAESLGSMAASLCVDMDRFYCVGVEINANHLRAVREGRVTGTARPVHVGRRTQVWQIDIQDDAGRLTAVSRLTLAVLEHQ